MGAKSGQNADERAPKPVWRFCGFTLDPNRQVLVCGSEEVRLRTRTYDVLAYLVVHPGRLISKTELIDSVWQDVAVTDDSLVQSLIEIRRALGDAQTIIKTIRGRGYLFEASVELVPASVIQPHSDAAEPLPFDTSRQRPMTRVLRWSLVAAGVLVAGITIVCPSPASAARPRPVRLRRSDRWRCCRSKTSRRITIRTTSLKGSPTSSPRSWPRSAGSG